MDAQRIEDITEWDGRTFSDGFVGLRRLADRGFSGAATDGTGWLFMLNGRVVGTVDAELDDFADASGTAYTAPEDVLPLLFAMQEQGGRKRAQYYTNDTPLSEADKKLSQGGFTGYIELSENVLSGDYYVTYTGGESRAAAFVGNARRVETGDDAFDLADDEVGIYTVYEVDLDVRAIPEPDTPSAGTAASESTGADASDDGDAVESTEADASDDGDAVEPTGVDESEDADAGDTTATGESTTADGSTAADDSESEDQLTSTEESTTAGESTTAEKSRSPDETDAVDDGSTDDGVSTNTRRDRGESVERNAQGETSERNGRRDTEQSGSVDVGRDDRRRPDPQRTVGGDGREAHDDSVFSEEAEWRETKSIPALDPKEASDPEEANDRTQSRDTGVPSRSDDRRSSPEPRSADASGSSGSAVSERRPDDRGHDLQRLRSALEQAEAERDELAAERDELADERDALASEVETLESEVDELEAEIDELRTELERLRDTDAPEGEEKRLLSPAEARAETNLFIRYGSKGKTTLEDAHDGEADAESLRENIRVEHHTSFDDEAVLVDGDSFETFLHGTMEYRFTRWIVEELPFEIRDTGNESALRDLYDALPKVDRAEIGGSVSVRLRENGEETREQREFDLVLRDRMGNPLFIAELNDSRAPTPEATLESLVANGGDVAGSNDGFAAAFAVTASFFEPGALETASDAVGGGLFNRSKRKSFVKLSRKRGYHLCLVESRDGGFHVTVPEL